MAGCEMPILQSTNLPIFQSTDQQYLIRQQIVLTIQRADTCRAVIAVTYLGNWRSILCIRCSQRQSLCWKGYVGIFNAQNARITLENCLCNAGVRNQFLSYNRKLNALLEHSINLYSWYLVSYDMYVLAINALQSES